MPYQKKHRKFGRQRSQRKAFLRLIAANLVLHGKIKTTEARAKEVRSLVEKSITAGKSKKIAAYRRVLAFFPKKTAHKIFYELAPKYELRPGGYTRIVKVGPRKSDGARMAVIEFVD